MALSRPSSRLAHASSCKEWLWWISHDCAAQAYSPIKPVLVFVSSRRQTRLTALDLIGFAAGDERPRQFVHCPEEELDQAVATIKVGFFLVRASTVMGCLRHERVALYDPALHNLKLPRQSVHDACQQALGIASTALL